MKAESENLSAQQSLDIITSMIREAKGNVQRNSYFFLLWGWVIAFANVGMFVLEQINYEHPYIVWAITIPAWIFTMVKVYSREPGERHVTHFDRISGTLWMCFGVSIFIMVVFGNKVNFQLNPLILTTAAIPTFVSGMIIRFKPLMLGGVAFWICGIVGFVIPMEYHPVAGAVAIVLGYLVPGYMLKSKTKVSHV